MLAVLRSVLLTEAKKLLTYRADFWIRSVVSVGVQVLVAWYLWSAIFAAGGKETIGGLSLHGMLFYYVIAGFVFQAAQPGIGMLAMEIYQGTLTRFLLYPVPFFPLQIAMRGAHFLLVAFQLCVTLLALAWLIGIPPELSLTPRSLCMGLVAMLCSGLLYYTVVCTLEIVAFWLDSVWTLVVMMRFLVGFFGGRLVPLVLFPFWLRQGLDYLPFPYLVSFPVRVMMGSIDGYHFLAGLLVTGLWITCFSLILALLWERGLKQYTAVGQ